MIELARVAILEIIHVRLNFCPYFNYYFAPFELVIVVAFSEWIIFGDTYSNLCSLCLLSLDIGPFVGSSRVWQGC